MDETKVDQAKKRGRRILPEERASYSLPIYVTKRSMSESAESLSTDAEVNESTSSDNEQ